jgi:ATP-dependent helicase/nuclease subunit B
MDEPKPFLERIAGFLLAQSQENLLQTLVVLPNRRSQVFLKQALAKKAEQDFWLPDMLTIDELMVQLSGLTVVDPLAAWFELYHIHRELEKDKARSADDFLSWAPLMLNDFNDVDFSLADAHQLFHELSEVRVMETWNPDGRPLTTLQKDYLAFFRSLFDYYERLQIRLMKRHSAYKAMAYRVAAEKLRQGEMSHIRWKNFVFAGFNALTEAEKQVVSVLKESFSLHYFIHADRYFFNPGRKTHHEAGLFLQQAGQRLKLENLQWVDSGLSEQEKTIEVFGIPGQTGQAKYAGQLLRQWMSEENTDATSIAVVLADERMLGPLLSAVPQTDGGGRPLHYNVTMGYPLTESPFYDLVYRWLQLLILSEEVKEKKLSEKISLPALDALMHNPLVYMLTGKQHLSDFFKMDRLYATAEEILVTAPDEKSKLWLEMTISDLEMPGDFLTRLKKFLQILRDLPELSEKEARLLRFQLVLMVQVLRLAENILGKEIRSVGLHGIRKILLQLMSRKEISLRGEPLTGIQVMGLLETRNLDFDKVLILGANEGVLPQTGFRDSFIPFDLRRAFGLPLESSKTAIASYYFFRLLQQPRKVALIYNSEPGVLGGGEVSRFVLQIENELVPRNPKIVYRHKTVYVPLISQTISHRISISKEPAVMELLKQLAERGISPSALNAYVRCPLQFYFRYVARIKEPPQPEVSVQSNTFGSVVHGTLEKLYRPFLGKNIDPEQLLHAMKENIDTLLQAEFKEIYGKSDMRFGRDVLIYKVARRYVERYVKNDAAFLTREPRGVVSLEKSFRTTLTTPAGDIHVKGFIDRIDTRPGSRTVRIIDYKTGTVTPGELKPDSEEKWEMLSDNPKYAKALQVLVYSWIYRKENPETAVEPGIVSLKSASGRFMPVIFPKHWSENDILQNIELLLRQMLSRIWDKNLPFGQTSDPKICEYCDFKQLCNR